MWECWLNASSPSTKSYSSNRATMSRLQESLSGNFQEVKRTGPVLEKTSRVAPWRSTRSLRRLSIQSWRPKNWLMSSKLAFICFCFWHNNGYSLLTKNLPGNLKRVLRVPSCFAAYFRKQYTSIGATKPRRSKCLTSVNCWPFVVINCVSRLYFKII